MEFLFNPGILWLSIFTSMASWAALFYINWDWIQSGGYKRIFTVLAGVHLFRFIGLAALSTEHVGPELGLSFTYLMQVAFGDWAANVLAIIASRSKLRACHQRSERCERYRLAHPDNLCPRDRAD
jgi:hypothetical protein